MRWGVRSRLSAWRRIWAGVYWIKAFDLEFEGGGGRGDWEVLCLESGASRVVDKQVSQPSAKHLLYAELLI